MEFTELLTIETYNDTVNKTDTVFRKLFVDFPGPLEGKPAKITVYLEDHLSGAAGKFKEPLTIITSNEIDRVPVFRVTPDGLDPIMVNPTPDLQVGDEGYQPPFQKTIGGFDVWKELVFENAYMPLKVAISDVVIREKKRVRGEVFTPMFYVE